MKIWFIISILLTINALRHPKPNFVDRNDSSPSLNLDVFGNDHSLRNFIIGQSKTLDYHGNHYYFFAIDPTKDRGVSKQMSLTGGNWEENLNLLFQHLWRTENRPLGEHVIDVGMNLGAFTMFAASLGCRLISFEMQPMLLTLVDLSLRVSGYRNRVKLYGNAVWHQSNHQYSFDIIPVNFAASEVLRSKKGEVSVSTVRIDDKVRPFAPRTRYFFLKMDVEGSEPYALLGMNRILRERRVRHVVIEARDPSLLSPFFALGYACRIFDNGPPCSWPSLGPECYMSNLSQAQSLFRSLPPETGRLRKEYMDVHCTLSWDVPAIWPPEHALPASTASLRTFSSEQEAALRARVTGDLEGKVCRLEKEHFLLREGKWHPVKGGNVAMKVMEGCNQKGPFLVPLEEMLLFPVSRLGDPRPDIISLAETET